MALNAINAPSGDNMGGVCVIGVVMAGGISSIVSKSAMAALVIPTPAEVAEAVWTYSNRTLT